MVLLWLAPRLQKWRSVYLHLGQWVEIVAWGAAGLLIGGRLGYVFFYEPQYFLKYPAEIFMIWQGGMSSHGGFIGVALAVWLACRSLNVDFWKICDVIVVPIGIGLALGRIGNYINQELYGTVTALPWGIEVPGETGLRHPVQLYAALKNITVAAICYVYLRKPHSVPGRATALFLMLYGTLRFFIEFIRVQDWPEWFGLTRGQWFTIPIIFLGAWLFFIRKPKKGITSVAI